MKKESVKDAIWDLSSLQNLLGHEVDLEALEVLDEAGGIPYENVFVILIRAVRQLRRERNCILR